MTLACTALYAWPRTSTLGAVLLTGLIGGAIATHLRIGDPHTLFGVYLGLFGPAYGCATNGCDQPNSSRLGP